MILVWLNLVLIIAALAFNAWSVINEDDASERVGIMLAILVNMLTAYNLGKLL